MTKEANTDNHVDRVVGLLATIDSLATEIQPTGDDSDGESLELLYGVLLARGAIRDSLDRVGRGRA